MRNGNVWKTARFAVALMLLLGAVWFPLQAERAAAAEELLANPGFESGSLTPWTTQNNAYVVSGNAHSGTHAVNLGTQYSGVQTTVTGLQPNTSYTLSAWVKTASDVIYLGAKNFAGTGTEVNTTTTSSAYTKLTVHFTTNSTTTSAYVFLYKNDNTGASYADDLSLTADTNVLNGNPDFESGALSPWTTQHDAYVVGNNAHSGSHAVNLGTVYSGVQQTVTGLSPNTAYTLTAWVKTQADVIYLGAKNFAGTGTEVNTTTTSPNYTKLTVHFTTNSTTTSAYIFLYKNDNAGASYADDIELTQDSPGAGGSGVSGDLIGMNTQDPYFTDSTTLNQLYDQVVSTGAKWVRVTLFWDLMEPTQGQIDWTKADEIFNIVKAKGLNMDLVIRSAPSWAAGGADTSDHNYAPTNGTAYGNICYQIAKRYLDQGVTIAFELGNEENMQFFNMPSVDPAQYTQNMLIPGSTGIRQAASELGVAAPTVMVGGFAPVEPAYVANSVAPLDFMQAIYDNGGQGYFDTIAYHTYTYVTAPSSTEWTFTELQSVVDLMDSMGDTNRKIWATETGWATGTGDGEISEADQATFTGQEFDYWFGLPYAGPMLWYELVDNSSYDNSNRENTFGLLHSSDWSEKPAYSVFVSKIDN